MYEAKDATKKMLNFMDKAIKYKVRYVKKNENFKYDFNLSERQIKILITLSIFEKNTVSEMAKFMNISKSTLSIILAKMIKKGLVDRDISNDEDKRKSYFSITQKGVEQIKKLVNFAFESFNMVYESFSDEKKKNIREGINKLICSLDSSNMSFYRIIIGSDYYKNIESLGGVYLIAAKFYLFFICFAEYYESILKRNINKNGDFKSFTRNRYNILHCIKYLELDTVSKLEAYLCQSSSAVSIAVTRLVKEGFLYKEYPKSGDDGRFVYIRLAQKGFDTIEVAEKYIFDVLTMYFEEFSASQRKDIIDACDMLLDL